MRNGGTTRAGSNRKRVLRTTAATRSAAEEVEVAIPRAAHDDDLQKLGDGTGGASRARPRAPRFGGRSHPRLHSLFGHRNGVELFAAALGHRQLPDHPSPSSGVPLVYAGADNAT